jgi:hypothetical protein
VRVWIKREGSEHIRLFHEPQPGPDVEVVT